MSTQPNTTDLDRQRAEFEEEMRSSGAFNMTTGRTDSGEYWDSRVEHRWQGWQAALARRSNAGEAAGIKTWEERITEAADAGKVLLPMAMMKAEIAELRAALATQQAAREQQEPVAWIEAAVQACYAERVNYEETRAPEDAAYNQAIENCIDAIRNLAAPVAQQSEAVQPMIGKLLDEFSELPVLWGLNEPGALVRHSDVFKMLIAASKAEKAGRESAAPDGGNNG